MRVFNNKKIELLAPAGNLDIFKGIIESGCDAIYFGGQRMNMRMIRKGFNFTDEELKEAILLANERGKSTYITLNNLLDFEESEAVTDYLYYIESIKPTGIIVQDFAVLDRVDALNLDIEVHASVMMNVHNLKMIEALEKKGVKRVVLSRETTLAEAHYYHQNSNVELEYFTHGDMCVAHGAQCYYSAMLYGMSSNRGKCLKPCRWWFDVDGKRQFPLAVKDLSMIAHLPEMIHSGITSFKIEGRMREKAFIVDLINRYADVFDRYFEDPIGYDYKSAEKWVHENRKRDLSTAYAFGNPGIENMNTRYEGTGQFYSTGKMFSTPTEESEIDPNEVKALKSIFMQPGQPPKALSVRTEDMAQAKLALEKGVNRIYIAADVFEPKRSFTIDDIDTLMAMKGKTELYVCTPKMMDECQFERFTVWLEKIIGKIDGILITNLGALEAFKPLKELGIKLVGDYSLNIFNKHAANFYIKEGLDEITPSIELPGAQLKKLIDSEVPCEVITHGRLTTMYMSHDLYKANQTSTEFNLVFENEAGEYLIKRDVFGKNHMLMQKHFTLLPIVSTIGASRIRIEAQNMDVVTLGAVIEAHLEGLKGVGHPLGSLKEVLPNHSCTLGAMRF
jgi:putative protease